MTRKAPTPELYEYERVVLRREVDGVLRMYEAGRIVDARNAEFRLLERFVRDRAFEEDERAAVLLSLLDDNRRCRWVS